MNLFIKLIFYILPFVYLIKSRLKFFNLFISWMFIFYFINILTIYLLDGHIDYLKFNIRLALSVNVSKDPPGIGSSYIFNLKKGDKVELFGPFGDFHLKQTA